MLKIYFSNSGSARDGHNHSVRVDIDEGEALDDARSVNNWFSWKPTDELFLHLELFMRRYAPLSTWSSKIILLSIF